MQPKISIVTVCYNAVKIIEETILSVINQTYTNIEYIIIDGGSKDGTVDIIKKYNDKIAYWTSESDNGIYDAMNKGIKKATGEWINFMNAGDSFCNLNVLAELNRNGAFDNYDLIYGDVIGKYKIGNRLLKAGNLKNITKTMQFSHQSTFAKCSLMKENLYVLTYRLAADYNFILSLYLNGRKFKYCPIPIAAITAEEGDTFTNFAKSKKEVCRIHLQNGYSYVRSLFYCYYYIVRFYVGIYVKRNIPDSFLRRVLYIKG